MTPEQQMMKDGGPAFGFGFDGMKTGMQNGQLVGQIVKMKVDGMSIRDVFAAVAMHAILMRSQNGIDQVGCGSSYVVADGMLVARSPDAPEADESPNGEGGPTHPRFIT